MVKSCTCYLNSGINKNNNKVKIVHQRQSVKHQSNFVYGAKCIFYIETTCMSKAKDWHGYIKFDHKDTSMAGKTVDFEDTSKMKVTLIIDDFGKVAKKMVVKGSVYDE